MKLVYNSIEITTLITRTLHIKKTFAIEIEKEFMKTINNKYSSSEIDGCTFIECLENVLNYFHINIDMERFMNKDLDSMFKYC